MKASEQIAKWLLISIATSTSIYCIYLVGSFIIAMIAFGAFDTTNYADLVKNYSSKEKELRKLKRYVNTITPPNKSVHIEFESDDQLGIFHVVDNGKYDSNWNIKIESFKADSLLQKLGWNRDTLAVLKTKLDKANCISVESGEPFIVGYQRSGMGMYSYNLFENPLTDSLRTHYNDSCRYIVFAPKVVLEYGGGVVGPQCFPDF